MVYRRVVGYFCIYFTVVLPVAANNVISLSVVIVSVIWSVGIMYLFGYKITLLTALVPWF